ncbi:MAG: aspartyl/asparaginyl beta-hydroxylase domain-containing protein [Rhizobacter sp.]|nr:aspartyl/asparaginyl beta-hydroxylase domain-containing protein [Burkholderiales bacterium]
MTKTTSSAVPFQPNAAHRLPLAFEVAPLVAEINALSAESWLAHFNTSYHDGGWTGIPLLTADGRGDSLYAPIRALVAAESAGTVRPTGFGGQCPRLLAAVAQLHCPVKCARILRLAPGSVIREHRDDDLIWCNGEARLHIPLQTNDRVEFYVDGRRIMMQTGQCWYLNLSRPHRVQNLGATARLHLVLDCTVNDWLISQVQSGFPPAPHDHGQDGASQFSQFRDVVFSHPELQSKLRNCAHLDELLAASVALGRDYALHFSIEDVRAQANRGRREWIEQWIV